MFWGPGKFGQKMELVLTLFFTVLYMAASLSLNKTNGKKSVRPYSKLGHFLDAVAISTSTLPMSVGRLPLYIYAAFVFVVC